MIHGGDLLSYSHMYDGELIDFSSNINPLGVPKGLKEHLFRNFDEVEKYPDIKYRKLKSSIAKYLGANEKNILVGNGAMEIIDIFNLIANRVITTSPAFSEYKLRAKVHGKEYLEINYDNEFKLNLPAFEKQIKAGDLIIIGNPNNPTGLRLTKEELLTLYDLTISRGAYLLLDEAFFEFAPDDYDSIKIFKKRNFTNVCIIRAATKFFAIPGLRLGYGCAGLDIVEKIEEKSLTWSVNTLAALAGEYIFNQRDYIEESKKYIEREREFLLGELKKIEGIRVYKSHTNYILIKLDNRDEDYAFNEFIKNGILIRKCSSFKTLGKNHIRVAIKDRDKNLDLVKAFNKINF